MHGMPPFVVWYYTAGLKGFLEISSNLFRAIFHVFNCRELFATLFAPWKRDISFKDWVGLHPIKWLNNFVNNLISRFIGSIVRACVIGFAFALAAVGGLLFVITLIIWLGWPLWMLVSIGALMAGGGFLWILLLLIAIALGGIIFSTYFREKKSLARRTDPLHTDAAAWPARVMMRLGLSGSDRSLLSDADALQAKLKELNITPEAFERLLRYERDHEESEYRKRAWWTWESLSHRTPIGHQWVFAYTPRLDRYSRDLTQHDYSDYAKWDLIGRKRAFDMMKLILSQERQTNVLLAGQYGVGKTVIIHYLARLIREQRVEPLFYKKRLIVFDASRALSEAAERRDNLELVLRSLLNQAAYAGNIILVIDRLADLFTYDQPGFNLTAILSEYFAYSSLQVVATASLADRERLIREKPALMKLFETVDVEEPTEAETIEIMLQYFTPTERMRPVFTWKALESIVTYSQQYNWDSPFPERAIDLARGVLLHWKDNGAGPSITQADVEAFLSVKTGIQIGAVKKEEQEKLLNLEDILHGRVIGQHEAISDVAEALRRARVGIANKEKPIGSFLFLGPTGVGKTETAKALAHTYFGDEDKMVRLDMSEFQNPDSLSRIIGSRELNQPGLLATRVRENPYGVLLLDEIEKAYKDILDLFLQVVDEGFFTDAFGKRVNFRNMIIIATSNAGALYIKQAVQAGESPETIRKTLVDKVVEQGSFRLEFLGRFDGVIVFRPLTHDEMKQVAMIKLRLLAERIGKDKNVKLTFTDGVAERLVKEGYDPVFGARSLNHYISDTIESALVKKFIQGSVANNTEIVFGVEDF